MRKHQNPDIAMTPPDRLLLAAEMAIDFVVSVMETLHLHTDDPSHVDELADTLVHLGRALKSTLRCYKRALQARSHRHR